MNPDSFGKLAIFGSVNKLRHNETLYARPPHTTRAESQTNRSDACKQNNHMPHSFCTKGVGYPVAFSVSFEATAPIHDKSPFVEATLPTKFVENWITITLHLIPSGRKTNDLHLTESVHITHNANTALQNLLHSADFALIVSNIKNKNKVVNLSVHLQISFLSRDNSFLGPLTAAKCQPHMKSKQQPNSVIWSAAVPASKNVFCVADLLHLEETQVIELSYSSTSTIEEVSVAGKLIDAKVSSKISETFTLDVKWKHYKQLSRHFCPPDEHGFFPNNCISLQKSKGIRFFLFTHIISVNKLCNFSNFVYSRSSCNKMSYKGYQTVGLQFQSRLLSWIQAAHKCREEGAQLPMFNSGEELEEFTHLVKRTMALPSVPAFFIALSKKKGQNKVRCFVFCGGGGGQEVV